MSKHFVSNYYKCLIYFKDCPFDESEDEDMMDEEEYAEAVHSIKVEWGKNCKNRREIARLMEMTRKARRDWIMEERPHSTAILSKFPPLKDTRFVRFTTYLR